MAIQKSETHALDLYIRDHQAQILDELSRLCAQPSISTQNIGIEETVSIVSEMLRARDFSVEVIRTPGNPVLLAQERGKSERALLLYNHYDVQPVDPLDAWITPPFQPIVSDGKFYARGAMDDKGHIACRLAAIDAVKAVYGELPCSITFIIEGEEEVGSLNLPAFVSNYADRLHADGCLWEFGDVDYDGTSLQYLGFRGNLYLELSVQTARIDSHSGITGTLLPNAAWRLTWALGSLKDASERVLLPGFYDDVLSPTAQDIALLHQMPAVAESYKETYGVESLLGGMSDGVDFYRAAMFSPSCTICGLTAGYQDKGYKTVLPARASAKVDFRLVPNQTPEDVLHKLRTHLDRLGFQDVTLTVLGSNRPSRTPIDNPFAAMVIEAARDVYGRIQRITPMCGGSGPAYLFTDVLGIPVTTVGVGYPGSQIHAPNENIRLVDFFNGVRHTARIIANFNNVL